MGIDLNPRRVELALKVGADDACTNDLAHPTAQNFTAGRGFDSVLITADTRSDEPVTLAGELARDRAHVVAVGAVGMKIPRKIYYDKELSFRVSRSYGPGRYDPAYEEKGQDYPYSYVRWTQQRNMETFVQLLASGAVTVESLITHRFAIDHALDAYEVITGKAEEDFLGVVLTYPVERELPERIVLNHPARTESPPQDSICLGLVGAGNFANNVLLPAIKDVTGIELRGVVSGSGLNARKAGSRFGFEYCTASLEDLLGDGDINWLAITTQHHLHASQTQAAMSAGKNVFVEKPLTVDYDSLVEVMRTQKTTGHQLMVGFNRRFAPFVVEMRQFVANHQRPLLVTYRINAGSIPANHWTQDKEYGGGRIVGEACHFLDLLQHLIQSTPVDVYAQAIRTPEGLVEDELMMTLTFADGSVGTVVYAAGGDKAYGKERIEIIGDGKVAVLDDFRTLELVHGGKRLHKKSRLRPSKGHREEWQALVEAVKSGGEIPIALHEIVAAHLATFAAVESLRQKQSVHIDLTRFWSQVDC
jgi:predicted dehydrogenase